MTTSACAANRRKAACAAGRFRLRTMPRLPRFTALKLGLSLPRAPDIRRVESPSGGSILITSAPMSHSCIAQNGPAITCVTSITLSPSSARRASTLIVSTLFDIEGPIAFLTFNRPEARNAMTWEMYEALVEACDRVDAAAAVRVFVLRGAGKAFVAGTDISQF